VSLQERPKGEAKSLFDVEIVRFTYISSALRAERRRETERKRAVEAKVYKRAGSPTARRVNYCTKSDLSDDTSLFPCRARHRPFYWGDAGRQTRMACRGVNRLGSVSFGFERGDPRLTRDANKRALASRRTHVCVRVTIGYIQVICHPTVCIILS